MGAITKETTIEGKTLKSAFAELQREEREEYGDDIYSGGWHLASGVRELKSREGDIEDYEPSKHEDAVAVCVCPPKLNKNKIKTTVENFPQKGTRKWETVYKVRDWEGCYLAKDKSQTGAIKKARALIDKDPNLRLEVYIGKELVGATKVAKISYKPSTNEKDGRWHIKGTMSY